MYRVCMMRICAEWASSRCPCSGVPAGGISGPVRRHGSSSQPALPGSCRTKPNPLGCGRARLGRLMQLVHHIPLACWASTRARGRPRGIAGSIARLLPRRPPPTCWPSPDRPARAPRATGLMPVAPRRAGAHPRCASQGGSRQLSQCDDHPHDQVGHTRGKPFDRQRCR